MTDAKSISKATLVANNKSKHHFHNHKDNRYLHDYKKNAKYKYYSKKDYYKRSVGSKKNIKS